MECDAMRGRQAVWGRSAGLLHPVGTAGDDTTSLRRPSNVLGASQIPNDIASIAYKSNCQLVKPLL